MMGFWVQAVIPDAVYIQPEPAGNMGNMLLAHSPLTATLVRCGGKAWHVWMKEDETRTCAQVYKHNKAHSCTNTAKNLTVTLLSVLRHSETGLTDDTCEGTLCVCTCSLGACSRQRTLINIWYETADYY